MWHAEGGESMPWWKVLVIGTVIVAMVWGWQQIFDGTALDLIKDQVPSVNINP